MPLFNWLSRRSCVFMCVSGIRVHESCSQWPSVEDKEDWLYLISNLTLIHNWPQVVWLCGEVTARARRPRSATPSPTCPSSSGPSCRCRTPPSCRSCSGWRRASCSTLTPCTCSSPRSRPWGPPRPCSPAWPPCPWGEDPQVQRAPRRGPAHQSPLAFLSVSSCSVGP